MWGVGGAACDGAGGAGGAIGGGGAGGGSGDTAAGENEAGASGDCATKKHCNYLGTMILWIRIPLFESTHQLRSTPTRTGSSARSSRSTAAELPFVKHGGEPWIAEDWPLHVRTRYVEWFGNTSGTKEANVHNYVAMCLFKYRKLNLLTNKCVRSLLIMKGPFAVGRSLKLNFNILFLDITMWNIHSPTL